MFQCQERAFVFFTKMFSHSVGNSAINRKGFDVLLEAERLQQRHPHSDVGIDFLYKQTLPLQRRVTVGFYEKVARAHRWQRSVPYWREMVERHTSSMKKVKQLIAEGQYVRAYQILSCLYREYADHLLGSPAKPNGIMISALNQRRDLLSRHYNKQGILSKKRF